LWLSGSFLLLTGPARPESIEGVVEFHGTAPAAEKLRRDSDRFCAKTPAVDPSVRVNGNRLRDVWVRITKGAPDQPGDPARTVAIKQTGCMFEPHVAAMQAGNRVTIENGDPVLHNVHAYAGGMTLFNRAMPGPGIIAFTGSGAQGTLKWSGVVRWKCDVHAWMSGFIGVSTNAYSAVSDETGAFRIENVSPGTYSLTAWHEKLGERVVELSVEPGRTAKAVFHYGQKLTQAATQ
jgi:plastocyanin